MARAQCVVAEAEIALVSRDLGWPAKALDAARATLEAHDDRVNAAYARYLEVHPPDRAHRRGGARARRSRSRASPPASRTAHELVVAGIAIRRLRTKAARGAGAGQTRGAPRHPRADGGGGGAHLALDAPAARLVADGGRVLLLEEVEALLASKALVVDACRHVVRHAGRWSRSPGGPCCSRSHARWEAWPGDVPRDALVARAFGSKVADDSYRARLRVEVRRLRTVLRALAEVRATKRGFALAPRSGARSCWPRRSRGAWAGARLSRRRGIVVELGPRAGARDEPAHRPAGARLLAAAGKVRSFGRGRARRWMTPPGPGFTTTLLLPPPLPTG